MIHIEKSESADSPEEMPESAVMLQLLQLNSSLVISNNSVIMIAIQNQSGGINTVWEICSIKKCKCS